MSLYVGNSKIGSLYLGSTKIAQAYKGSTLVYNGGTPPPAPTVWVDLGSTQYDGIRNGTNVYFNTMPASSDLQYMAFVMDAMYDNANMAAQINFVDTNSSMLWRSRAHANIGVGFVGITGAVTDWATNEGETVTSKTQDNISWRISARWTKGNWVKIKIAFDRINKIGYFYIDGYLIGYATLTSDMLTCARIKLVREQNSGTNSHIKNIKIAGFTTLAAAQAYEG